MLQRIPLHLAAGNDHVEVIDLLTSKRDPTLEAKDDKGVRCRNNNPHSCNLTGFRNKSRSPITDDGCLLSYFPPSLKFPEFLANGASRCRTTWTYPCCEALAEIWLPSKSKGQREGKQRATICLLDFDVQASIQLVLTIITALCLKGLTSCQYSPPPQCSS